MLSCRKSSYVCGQSQSQRYVDLRSDAGFKAVFADRGNRELLRQTLNLLLPEENAVEEITEYLDREQETDFIGGKRTYCDLVCKGQDGRRFIVELQKEPQTAFFERCVYYCAGTYHGQLGRGDLYDRLCPVFLIGILNFRLAHRDESQWDSDHIVSRYCLQEFRTGELAPPTISCIFAGFPEDKKLIYDEDMISERDIAAKCDYAFGEGEAKKSREIALTMLQKGLSLDVITGCTGLSEAEVLALKAN